MSAGKAAMWTIGSMITVALVATLALAGVSGMPAGWLGVGVAVLFAGIAFALGNYE